MTNFNFYSEELQKYKTTASKKAFLTRSKKEASEFLADQEKSYSRAGYLHGLRVTRIHLRETKNEIRTIEQLYKKL